MKRGLLFVEAFLLAFVFGSLAQEVCYGPLGCFTNDPPFTSALLTQPLLPKARDVIGVTYSLFVRHQSQASSNDVTEPNSDFQAINITGPYNLSHNSRVNRKWRQLLMATRQTKIIIHDYEDTSTNAWVFAMIEKFLQRDDCQVITVGWTSPPDGASGYYQATANARLVGAEIALLLKNIKAAKPEFEYESVHLIGHGIGAHIASYVGEALKIDDRECLAKQEEDQQEENEEDSESWWELPSWLRSERPKKQKPKRQCPKLPQIGQITGLDPAGLWYESTEFGARLDPSDAIFVDVIHTDVIKQLTSYFGHGIVLPSGNVDFYPNGGYNQPGCSEGVTGFEGSDYPHATQPRQQMDCNHLRAIVFYLSSMDTDSCTMTSFPCTSWRDFRDAKCTSCIYNFESDSDSDNSISGWLNYLGIGGRRRRTSAPVCLQLGPTTAEYWTEHQRRAAAAETGVRNIKAYLKTGSSAPYCLKYIRIELELNEPSSEGTLSFRLTDQTNHRTEYIKVGRVSNWGSTTSPTYLVTVPDSFGGSSEVRVLWEMGVTSSWWPGIGGHRSDSRKELKLPLNQIKVTAPPNDEILTFCSPRKRLRSKREQRFTHCGTESSYDYLNYEDDAEE